MRQLTGRNHAVMHSIVARAGLLHEFAAEDKWIGRGQHHSLAVQVHTHGSVHMFESSYLGGKVVASFSGFNMLICRAAFENQMADGVGLLCIGVVRDFVSVKNKNSVVDFYVALQRVN